MVGSQPLSDVACELVEDCQRLFLVVLFEGPFESAYLNLYRRRGGRLQVDVRVDVEMLETLLLFGGAQKQ